MLTQGRKSLLKCLKPGLATKSVRAFSTGSEVQLYGHKIDSLNEETDKHILFLHSILCQARHWRSFALSDVFSQRAHCHMIDLRNHGESDHHDDMSYQAMAEDVIRYADRSGVERFDLIGHSMGGKLAMAIGSLFEDRVNSIVSLDAAPVDNNKSDPKILENNRNFLNTLLSLDIDGKTRKNVIDMLNEKFPDRGTANLISMNIIYDGDSNNTVKWCTNLKALRDNLENIIGFPDLKECNKPFMCLYGENSRKFGLEEYRKLFPNCKEEDIVEIKDAGHWLHFEKQQEVLSHIDRFYKRIDAE